MRQKNFLKQSGLASNFTVVAILLLAVSLPITVLLVQKNQENRSNAASEINSEFIGSEESDITDISGVCGGADGKNYASRPTNDLCTSGSILWKDSSGNDGSYIWSCVGGDDTNDANSMDCSALKLSKDEGGSIDGRCGDANETEQSAKSNSTYLLCKSGELNWIDDKADDGDFNWSCKGFGEGDTVECLAFKAEE